MWNRQHRAHNVFRLILAGLICTSAAADQLTDTDWPTYGNDSGSSKYAPLDQINRDTVSHMKIAWMWESPDNALIGKLRRARPMGYKSTPIKIGDRLYVSTSLGQVASLDAASGETHWVFDTRTYEHGRPANLGFNHRGVAYWERADKRRIFMGTNNGFLWSLDADTGKPDAAFGKDGRIDLTSGLGRPVSRRLYSVVAPPMVVSDTVVVGAVVSDAPLAGWAPNDRSDIPPGHIRGFDPNTGERRWIFHTIPKPGEAGNDSWEQESWRDSGGTNVWTMMSADPELGYLYLPIGTPSNDWYGGHRPGNNLYGESLVCLDARTGKPVWHFQMVHHGLWDYDLPAAPNLIDITVDDKPIRAVAQVSKQGYVYVFDRVTGEPVWPIAEQPVPQSTVPGERTSPTQPVPSRPAPFSYQGISEDILIDFTPELKKQALKAISAYDYGPLFTPPTLRGTIQLPGDGGGGEWSGAAFDPDTSRFYIPAMNRPIVVRLVPHEGNDAWRYVRGGATSIYGPRNLPLLKPPYATISAINMDTGDYDWTITHGDGYRQRFIDMGIPDPGPVGAPGIYPPMLTRSLLFIGLSEWGGRGRGGGKNVLRAIDKRSGELVHETSLPLFPQGAPMTYLSGGRQFIVIAVGGSSDARLVALALPEVSE